MSHVPTHPAPARSRLGTQPGTGARLLAVGVLTLLLAACGGTQPAPTPSDTATSAAKSAASTSPTSVAASSTTPTRLTQAQLDAAIIGVKDLPSGWSRDPATPSPTTSSPSKTGICGSVKQARSSSEKADRSFTRGGGLTASVANVQVTQYPSADAATTAWQAAVGPLANCTSWTDDKGERWTVAEMSAPRLGDDQVAMRMQGSSVAVAVFLVRTGPAIVMVIGGGMVDLPVTDLELMLKAQVAAYTAAAASAEAAS